MTSYHSIALSEVFSSLDTNDDGLTQTEAAKRLEEVGQNILPKEQRYTLLSILLDQFKNWFIYLLCFATVLSLILGDYLEAIAIFVIILLNAGLGFFQEFRAEKAMEALQKVSAPTARVVRDGKERKIPAAELVPGDIIVLEAGDIVAADARLVSCESLQVEEASLTGESVPSVKNIGEVAEKSTVPDQHNMVFMGTTVTYGKGTAVVVGTGKMAELGKIAQTLQETRQEKTPLQVKFEQLSRQIGIIALGLISFVFVAGMINHSLSVGRMVVFALALVVAILPQALPVIVTISLAIGSKRLARKNLLIRRLQAAETIGATKVICSDKTGTLTQNQMTVTDIYMDGRMVHVEGSGYKPEGRFLHQEQPIDVKDIHQLLKISALCNNAQLVEEKGDYSVLGDPTEGSLVVLSRKGSVHKEGLHKSHTFIKELPFDSDRKLMSVVYLHEESKKHEAYVKGAPDILLERCTHIFEHGKIRALTPEDHETIKAANDDFASRALRVLGVAYRDVSSVKEHTVKNIERDMIFVGLVGMIDPPRKEVPTAIKACQDAGIKVIVITGDHPTTAKAVASQIGLLESGDMVLTGEELDAMSDVVLEEKIDRIRIIARALPIQKLRIVEVLQKRGEIVAMTGDGVNDAPALKKANIGIAMGITGTDVAKAVSDAILVDDNFATIVSAIGEGRDIHSKMLKSATYLLSCNAGEITSVILAILWSLPLPLIPLQILMMNILTDEFPAFGIAIEKAEKHVMQQKPLDPLQPLITHRLFLLIVIFGLVMGLGTLFVFEQYLSGTLAKAQTMAFTTLVMFQLVVVVSCRYFERGWRQFYLLSNPWLLGGILISVLLQVAVVQVPFLQDIFGTTPLTLLEWAEIIGIALGGLVLMEALKWFILPRHQFKERMLP